MPILDLTLNNPLIKGYLESSLDPTSSVLPSTSTPASAASTAPAYVPTSELMYIHTHAVQDNFVSQIEAMILNATVYFSSTTKKRGVAEKIRIAAEKLATLINPLSEETAPEALAQLRIIYQNCKLVTQ